MGNTGAFHIDLHVHSAQYSECAETLKPSEIAGYAKKAGLDAVALTEHDSFWDRDTFQALQQKSAEIQMFNGMELTTRNGYHLVIIGPEYTGPLQKGLPCRQVVDFVHEQNGIVILAHPFRNDLPPLKVIEQFDAIEVGSTSLHERESKLAFTLANELKKPAIACSDAHALSMIGWGYTAFPHKPESVQHLCSMIREGLGKPVLPNRFY